uniref:RRM domain-containing protein n=1 Tax=Romanomermis culicivorax TaxID=13658 RepID=A0A915KEB6_ROMCU
MMAFNRQETTVYRGRDGTDTLERIFFHVTDEDTVEILRDEFSQYGTISDCVILRRRYAYISFSRPLEAARAIEGCEAKSCKFAKI